MQKTITINGKKYTGRQIASMMDASKVERIDGLAKFVTFGSVKIPSGTYPLEYCCEYRHDGGNGYYAPVVKYRSEANCIRIECRTFDEGDVWLSL